MSAKAVFGRYIVYVIEFYRILTAFLFNPIAAILPFAIPDWYRDMFFASILLMSIFVRSYVASRGRFSLLDPLFLIASSIVFTGFVIFISSLSRSLFFALKGDREALTEEYNYLVLTLTALIAAAAFVIINALPIGIAG